MATTADLLTALENAWNTGDGAAWAENFSEDAFFVDALGGIHRGNATLRLQHQDLFDTVFHNSIMSLRVVDARPLADGLQLLHLGYAVAVPAGPRAGEFEGLQTILVRDGEILDFQNTVTRHDPEMAGIAGHPDN